jgi:hypothetical protein
MSERSDSSAESVVSIAALSDSSAESVVSIAALSDSSAEDVVSIAPFVCKWLGVHSRSQRFNTQKELEHHVFIDHDLFKLKWVFQLLLEKNLWFLNFLICSYAETFLEDT